MLSSYDKFINRIRQINEYIDYVYCCDSYLNLKLDKTRCKYRKELMQFQDLIKQIPKRQFDYSVVIISLYGCFEQCIEDLIKEYLVIIVNKYNRYSELPKNIQDNNVNLSIILLTKLDQSKYIGIVSKENIINNLHECIYNDKSRINYDSFCQHNANFRIQTISEVFKNIGFNNILKEITKNEELKNIYLKENGNCNYESLELNNVFSFVNELADRRNKIAHGSIDDILQIELQKVLVKKIELFMQEINKIIFKKTIPYRIGESYKISKVYEAKGKLLCCQISNITVKLMDILFIKRNDKFELAKIIDIEIEHKKNKLVTANEDIDVGLKLDINTKPNDEYWLYSV